MKPHCSLTDVTCRRGVQLDAGRYFSGSLQCRYNNDQIDPVFFAKLTDIIDSMGGRMVYETFTGLYNARFTFIQCLGLVRIL
jgi:hypothetical protein